MMEILALGSIVSRNVIVTNETVVFASISNFEKHNDFLEGKPHYGTVTLSSNKGGFLRYKGALFTADNTPICSGDMLAFFTTGELGQDCRHRTPNTHSVTNAFNYICTRL